MRETQSTAKPLPQSQHSESRQSVSQQSGGKAGGKPLKPAAPIRQRLKSVWLVWLVYRALALPILVGSLNPNHPDIAGGIFWQLLWLVPAFILTPWMITGRSPYALLMGSMLTLVYFGASGVVLFSRVFDTPASLLWIYGIDVLWLLLINVWLFILLKRLPSMNKVTKS